jgi:uncharacterized membrane protein
MDVQRYPVDRTIYFSDAVFAIAMTLLILEIKIPNAEEFQQIGVAQALIKRIPNLIGFTVSFLVTALFWRAHLQLCSYAKSIDNRFLWLNIGILFFVVLLPFTTAVYSSYAYLSNVAFGLYCVNIAIIGFFVYVLARHVIAIENLAEQINALELTWMKRRLLVTPIVFLLCAAFSSAAPIMSRYGFLAIFIVQFIGDKINQRALEKAGALTHSTKEIATENPSQAN